MQSRSIRALSDQDVAALLAGQASGLAKAAELNGYPGPAHVLELAEPLRLSEQQRIATRTLLVEHKARASRIGGELVAAERELDRLLAEQHADGSAIDETTRHIGLLQARLRADHLRTHLAQTARLSAEQVQSYQVLRGYVTAAAPGAIPEQSTHHH